MISQFRGRLSRWLDGRFPIPKPVVGVHIHSERLILREIEPQDHAALCAIYCDEETLRYQERIVPYSEQEVWNIIFHFRRQIAQQPRNGYTLAIVLAETDSVVGEINITPLFKADGGQPTDAATIGFMIQRDRWNCGYATEAARAALGFAFTELKFERIFG